MKHLKALFLGACVVGSVIATGCLGLYIALSHPLEAGLFLAVMLVSAASYEVGRGILG